MYFPRLKTLRENSGLTQIQIAKQLGIQQTVYSRYERGIQSIPLQFLLYLSEVYRTSTDYILGKTDISMPYNDM